MLHMIKNCNHFQVKPYNNNHDCNKVFENPRISQFVLVELCTDKFRKNHFIKDLDVYEDIRNEYGTKVNINMIRRAKNDVADKIVRNY